MMSLTPQQDEDPFARTLRTNSISLTSLVIIGVQTIGLIIWLVQMHQQISFINGQHTEMVRRLESVDNNGTRALSVITQRLGSIEGINAVHEQRIRDNENRINNLSREITAFGGRFQGQIDVMSSTIKRLEEQQLRIIQALDNTYNLLQEHMRAAKSQPPPEKQDVPKVSPESPR